MGITITGYNQKAFSDATVILPTTVDGQLVTSTSFYLDRSTETLIGDTILTNKILVSSSYLNGVSFALKNISFKNCVSYDFNNVVSYRSNLETIYMPNLSALTRDYAFSGCSKLREINFNNCEYISSGTFHRCSSLTSAYFPNCSYIGSSAFYGCSSLSSISFPKCTYIGVGAFYGTQVSSAYIDAVSNCYVSPAAFQSFKQVSGYSCIDVYNGLGVFILSGQSIPNFASVIFYMSPAGCSALSNSMIRMIGESAFKANVSCFTYANFPRCSIIGSFAFRWTALNNADFDKCNYVGQYAFNECSHMTSINLGTCSAIDNYAFYSCYSLTTVNLNSLYSVGSSAFMHCYSLSNINLGNVTALGDYAFYLCSCLSTWYSLSYCSYVGGANVFYSSPLESLYTKDGLVQFSNSYNNFLIKRSAALSSLQSDFTFICDRAYAGDDAYLQNVSLPNCSYIGVRAFNGCTKMKSLTLPSNKSNLTICESAFIYCSGLTSVNYFSAKKIGASAFQECSSLQSISFKCNDVGSYAFGGCTSLNNINIDNNKPFYIKQSTFYNCTNLSTVNIQNCVGIDTGAFMSCSNLLSFNFKNVSYVNTNAFNNCSKLSGYNLDNICYAGDYAFRCCSLRSARMNKLSSVGTGCFISNNNLSYVEMNNLSVINTELLASCTNLQSAIFNNAKAVGRSAFKYCTQLLNISLPACEHITDGYAFDGTWFADDQLESKHYAELVSPITSKKFLLLGYHSSCTTITNDCTDICGNCFSPSDYSAENTYLTYASFSKCTIVGTCAFASCVNLSSVYLPECEILANNAFTNCSALTSISLPKCKYVGKSKIHNLQPGAFWLGAGTFTSTSIQSLYLPECVEVFEGGLKSSPMVSINLPKVKSIGYQAIYYCRNLTTFSASLCEHIGQSAFEVCDKLTSVSFPNCSYVGFDAFNDCELLSTVSIESCLYIGNQAFYGCSSLTKLFIGKNSVVCSLASSAAFLYAGITSSTGSIYVPSSMLNSYKTAKNWSYFSNRIFSSSF